MKPLIWSLPLLLVVSICRGNSPHDHLELISGEIFYGKVLRLNDNEVSIQLTSGGILSFRRSQVKRVRARHMMRGPQQPELPPLEDDPPPAEKGQDGDEQPIIVDVDGKPAGPRPAGELPPASRFGRVILSRPDDAPEQGDDSARPSGQPAQQPSTYFESEEHGFLVRLPDGFVASQAAEANDFHRSWRDTRSAARLSLTFLPGDSSLLTSKKDFVRNTASSLDDFRIEQDTAFSQHGYDGWLVEIAGGKGPTRLRKAAFFALAPRGIVRVETHVPESEVERLAPALHLVWKSLRLLETAAGRGASTSD